MKNKEKMMIFGGLVLIMLININLTIAQESNETFIIAGREFTKYGNITVESSVLKALTVENRSKIRVGIWVNETIIKIKDRNLKKVKTEIISDFKEDEFKFEGTIEGRNWIDGYLTAKGLEILKNNPYIFAISETGSGTVLEEEERIENKEGKIVFKKIILLIVLIIVITLIILYLIVRKKSGNQKI